MLSSWLVRGRVALVVAVAVVPSLAPLAVAQQPAAPAAPAAAQQATAPHPKLPDSPRPPHRPFPTLPGIEEFRLKSECVSSFWGIDRFVEGGVVQPLDRKPGEMLPVVYNVHGFGGSHAAAWQQGPALQAAMAAGESPRMLYVFLNAQYEWGHHEFADSRCNGPWGRALTTEYIPALEKKYGAVGEPWARFVTGHSSGGWSSLWLQVAYPELFGGCWSTAPDSVDFRDFTGIDVYEYDNGYKDPKGEPIMLVRRGGKFVESIEQYARMERKQEPVGGQFFSFNAVFSELGADGMPKLLMDWETGDIDPEVAWSWQPYDIGLQLRQNWKELGPKLAGKIHVYVGTWDTFRLDGALHLLHDDLAKLGSDAQILFVEERDHGTLYAPHPTLWPKGMMERIHREMFEKYVGNAKAHATEHAAGK